MKLFYIKISFDGDEKMERDTKSQRWERKVIPDSWGGKCEG